MDVKYGNLPFKEAIAFFRAKLNVPTERWNDIWRTGHNSAFMVAGVLKDDLLNDFRQSVDRAIAEGKSLTWFKREFKQLVNRHGWDYTGSADWRSDIIYQTNMRQSYNAGRFEQLQHFEYWEYQHGDSITPRPHHLSWHGKVLSKDDPWWQTHMPQNGWGCKCKVRGRSKQALDRMGKTVSNPPNAETYEWIDKATGESHNIPKGIDPGFDYAPSKTKQLEKRRQARAKASEPYQAPKRIVPTAFSTVKGVNVHGLNRILDDLLQTQAQPQIEWLGRFIADNNKKTLFIKSGEMGGGKGSWDIATDVAEYLGLTPLQAKARYTAKSRPEGFTSQSFDHVVVKVGAKHNFNSVNVETLRQGMAIIIQQGVQQIGPYDDNGKKLWGAFAQAVDENMSDSNSRFLTWLHEMSHQVHYALGQPKRPTQLYLTHYSDYNDKEWFAEHFSAYLLARTELNQHWPDVVTWFDAQLATIK